MSDKIEINEKDYQEYLQLQAKDQRMKDIHKKANLKRRARVNILLVKAEKGGLTVSEVELTNEIKRLNKLTK